jgi:hypothetical protein
MWWCVGGEGYLKIIGVLVIQVDIGGHPSFPTRSKQFFGNFGNLLFLAVFNLRGHFESLNEGFSGSSFLMIAKASSSFSMIPFQRVIVRPKWRLCAKVMSLGS